MWQHHAGDEIGTDLLKFLQNFVCVTLARHLGLLYFLHPPDVFSKVTTERFISWGIVDSNDVRY